MAIGIPVFLALLLLLPKAGMSAGPALVTACFVSVLVVETLERLVMTTPSRRRLVTLFFLGVLLVYLVLLPFYLTTWGSS